MEDEQALKTFACVYAVLCRKHKSEQMFNSVYHTTFFTPALIVCNRT